jgi:acyl dehydratase
MSIARSGRQFGEVGIGDALGPWEVAVSSGRNRDFAACCGLYALRFSDDETARREGLPGKIFPGNLSLALLSKLVTDWLGCGTGQLRRLGTTYRSPVRPEQPIILRGFVTQVDRAARTAELDVWIENDDGDRLVIGTATAGFA